MQSPKSQTIMVTVLLLFTATLAFADGIIITPPEFPRLSIQYHHVDVTIENQVATTHVDQVFINKSPFQMEGEYLFPLPNDVSISEFAMYVGGERLKAELLDSQRAREIYEEIVRSRRDPALLEYIGTNMFRARVFPIEPHSEKRIELEYAEVLKSDADLTQYRYPLNTEKFSADPLESVSITVDLRSHVPIKTIYSPSHSLTIERMGEFAARVVYADENIKPETDFLLYYSVSPDAFGVNLLTYRDPGKDGFYLLMLTPTTQPSPEMILNKNVTFVLDTSGSMRGEKIEQAKAALRFSIHGLRETDAFNIVDFSTDVRHLSKQPLPATADNVRSAMRYLNQLSANGGTNINDALLAGLSYTVTERVNMVVFLTDGLPTIGVTDNAQILANVRKANADGKRIFAFGVGYDVNAKMLDQLALDNRGITAYVHPEEDIEVKVSSFFTKISNPVLSNPRLDFSTIEVQDTYPKQLPDLFAGSQFIQFGRYTASGHTAIILRGEVNGNVRESIYEATFPHTSSRNEFIPRLWATRKIGYLLDEIRLHGELQELVDEIVRLSKQYGVITPYTSFLILEDQPPPPGRLEADLSAEVGREAVQRSQLVHSLKSSTDASATTPPSDRVKVVGAKTFFWRDGFWRDSSFTDGTPTIDVEYASDAYFDLLRIDPELGKYFALGPKVIVEYRGSYYRVVETPVGSSPFPWDVNRDGMVDVFDLVAVVQVWGASGGIGDVNADGKVDVFDLVLIGNHFGERYNVPAAPSLRSEGLQPVAQVAPALMRTLESINGELITVRVSVESAADLMGYQFDWRYDGVELLSVEAGALFDPKEGAYFNPPQIDATAGLAKHVAAVRFGNLTPTGNLAVATFRKQAAGGAIHITNIKLSNQRGEPIPVHLVRVTDPRIHPSPDRSKTLGTERFALGQNYPNPFNPETWIPFKLGESANVTIRIYAHDGAQIRKLELGHLPAGDYLTRDRAAHWDGLNAMGEPVASGIYFYELKAGPFTAKRKMMIRK